MRTLASYDRMLTGGFAFLGIAFAILATTLLFDVEKSVLRCSVGALFSMLAIVMFKLAIAWKLRSRSHRSSVSAEALQREVDGATAEARHAARGM